MNEARTIICGKLDFLESVHEMSQQEYKDECFSARLPNLKVPRVVIESARRVVDSVPVYTNQFGDWPKIIPGKNQELFLSFYNPCKDGEEVNFTLSEYNGKVYVGINISVADFNPVNEVLPEEEVDFIAFEVPILSLRNADF